MAKPKSPLLSLGARGTIGDALTFQKRGRETIAREKPIPRDPYSLNQAYQRWDYRDYAYLWTLLSNSEKQIYRTKASRYHITGFSQWMRENLKTLPDLALRYHLDEKAGAIAYDSSKQGNNGTIIGASPAAGLIAGGYYFDGINDYINCRLVLPTVFTIESFVRPFDEASQYFCGWKPASHIPAIWLEAGTLRPIMYMGDLCWRYWVQSAWDTLRDGYWHHVAFTLPGSGQEDIEASQMFIDGELIAVDSTKSTAPQTAKVNMYIGSDTGTRTYKGDIDEFRLEERILSQTEIIRHSGRRYPV